MAQHPLPAGEPYADGAEIAPAGHRAKPPAPPRARHRRVTTEPPAGSDPTPEPETPRHSGTENDEQLKSDKPPHWG